MKTLHVWSKYAKCLPLLSFSAHRKLVYFLYRNALNLVKSLAIGLIPVLMATYTTLAQVPPSGFSSMVVSSGWDGAVGLTFNKDGSRLFVWEKGGKVYVVQNGVKKLLIDISPEVGNFHDHGMLGFALHPDFDANGYFYLLYVVDRHHLLYDGTAAYNPASNLYFAATIGRLTRYKATKNGSGDYVTDPASRTILIGATKSTGIPILSKSHGVGSLVFGADGTLLISTGDGASPSATDGGGNANGSYALQGISSGIITDKEDVGAYRSQLLESLNGKILRIDPMTGSGIPSNPYYQPASPNSNRSKVYGSGLRNPFRMVFKPGTGNPDPAAGNPGVLYLGDVGFLQWEELNVVTKAGMNFGWPEFEGLQLNAAIFEFPSYHSLNVPNRYAPNPLHNISGCTQPFFNFKDLIKQVNATATPTFVNPCNNSQTVPASINTFVHSRPVIDWKHGVSGPARTGTFSGETAAVINIGAPTSPVTGVQFGGNSAVGGVWYTGTDFPAAYRNMFFFGDYAKGWIRVIRMDATDKPKEVKDFITSGAKVLAMAAHPKSDGLYYIHYDETGSELRKVYYNTSLPPVAVASSNKTFGPGPLTVQFTGSNSSDPAGLPLTYEWNFGNGTPVSTLANPSHIFNAPSGVPTRYNVTLKVTNNNGVSATSTTLVISVNNTPPNVTIISPVNNSLYPVPDSTVYILKATVTDAEHSGAALNYQWQTIQHHEDHTHPGPIDTKAETTTLISPEGGCDGETYFFVITLKVTDAAGLTTTKSVTMYPDCSAIPTNATGFTATAGNAQVVLNWNTPTNYDEVMIVAKPKSPVTASPTGNGSAYVANLNYASGSGSSFNGGRVVYKGTSSPKTVTGLNNNTTYFFKVFSRKGTNWSAGVEANVTPFHPAPVSISALWNKRFGGNLSESFRTVVPTSDGGYLLGGHSSSIVSGDKTEASRGGLDYWVVKVNSAGIKEWDRRFGGTSDDYLNAIVPTPDGGFLLGGNSLSGAGGDKTDLSYGERDYWVVKINSAGVKQWDKRYGGTLTEDLRCIIPTSDGGFMLGGHSFSGIGGNKTQDARGDIDYWLVKINSDGVKQWDKRYGSVSRDNFEVVIQTADGGYLLGGGNLSSAGGDKTEPGRGGMDYWVVKVNSTGTKEWDKRFGGLDDDDLYSVVQTSDGGYLLGGRSNSGTDGDKGAVPLGSFDFWVLKISSTGSKLWDKRFGSAGNDELTKIVKTTDGGYLLAGNSDSGIGGDKTQASQGGIDFWVLKVNGGFGKMWDKRYGGTGTDQLRHAFQTSEGGYLLGGRSNSDISGDKSEASRGGYDYWITRIVVTNNPGAVAMPQAKVSVENQAAEAILMVSPNPFTYKLQVNFTVQQTGPVTLKIYNDMGVEVKNIYQGEAQAGKQYSMDWEAKGYKSGMYVVRLGTFYQTIHKKVILTR